MPIFCQTCESRLVLYRRNEEVTGADSSLRRWNWRFPMTTLCFWKNVFPALRVGCAVLGNDVLTVGAVDEIELQAAFDYAESIR